MTKRVSRLLPLYLLLQHLLFLRTSCSKFPLLPSFSASPSLLRNALSVFEKQKRRRESFARFRSRVHDFYVESMFLLLSKTSLWTELFSLHSTLCSSRSCVSSSFSSISSLYSRGSATFKFPFANHHWFPWLQFSIHLPFMVLRKYDSWLDEWHKEYYDIQAK